MCKYSKIAISPDSARNVKSQQSGIIVYVGYGPGVWLWRGYDPAEGDCPGYGPLPNCGQNDTLWKHYLPATSLAGSNKQEKN